MSSLYKYICPNCHYREEEKNYTDLYGTTYREYRCSNCQASYMYCTEEDKDKHSCYSCGKNGTKVLWKHECPRCGTPMIRTYLFPTYSDSKIVKVNSQYLYFDMLVGKLFKVHDFEEEGVYLRKFSVQRDGRKLWGLVDNNNLLVLYPKYTSVKTDNWGNIFVTYSERGDKVYEVNLYDCPIKRIYDKNRETVRLKIFSSIYSIYYDSDFEVFTENNKEGLRRKDGAVILNPDYDFVHTEKYWHDWDIYCAYNKEEISRLIVYPRTYGEGWVLAEECFEEELVFDCHNSHTRNQFFIDRFGNKKLVFDSEWKERHDVHGFCIGPKDLYCFDGGIFYCVWNDYYWKIDRKGNIESLYMAHPEPDHYLEPDYFGYDELGYYGIADENYRDAFDDDPEAFSSID